MNIENTPIFDCESFNIAKVRKTWDDIKLGYDTESDVAYYVLDWEWKMCNRMKRI